jgi:predicted NodU family carbamoyl transferase
MIIASLYPCPFDNQDRHDPSASIIKDGVIYAYEEAKLTGLKEELTIKFPERSLLMGCKELNILPSQIDQ